MKKARGSVWKKQKINVGSIDLSHREPVILGNALHKGKQIFFYTKWQNSFLRDAFLIDSNIFCHKFLML
jgi:hypothetical protein